MNSQVLHSASLQQLDVVGSMKPFFAEHILPLLPPVDDLWQPSDFLPAPHQEDFFEQARALKDKCADLPDELLICLIGDMITEEALPTYMTMVNTVDGVRDETGSSQHPYAKWTRSWIAEENRHGDLLNKFLWLTGRVDLRSVEKTIQRLIASGMNPQTENNPYLAFTFTSFQERATKLSHGSTARIAKKYGNEELAKLCGVIAADESRHEMAYKRTMSAIFDMDPSNAVIAFADMMRKKIVMPAHNMDDGVHGAANGGRNLFEDFSAVAEQLEVYTPRDYCSIMDHLIDRWNVPNLVGLTPEAEEAQQYLCKLPERIRSISDRKTSRLLAKNQPKSIAFSWLFDRTVPVL